MNCTLENKDYENLFIIAFGALSDSKTDNKAFDIKSEIQSLYEALKDDQAYAVGLIQAYPSQLVMAITHSKELSKYHRANGLSTDSLLDLADEFEDINNVAEYLGPDQVDKEALEAINNSIQNEAEKPAELPKLTPDQIEQQSQVLINHVQDFIFKGVSGMATTGQQALLDQKGKWTQEKNTELDFYYNFFKIFNEEFIDVEDAEKVTINGHTGFKLKVISKTQIDIEDAKPYDQRLVKGEEGYPAARGQALYHGGIAVAITNNEGNILYFDENYNVTSKDQGGKPIYHNIRYISKEGNTYSTDAQIQSIEEMAKNLAISPEMAHAIRQNEFKILYDVRNYINEKRKENSILLDITGVSQGVLNIRKNLPTEIDTSINSINWEKSDIELNIKIAKRDDGAVGERKGGVYISIPGHRSIPIQAGNLSQEDIDKVLDLILNPDIVDENGSPITADVKVKLIEYIILTNDESLQVMDKKGKFIALFKGKKITSEMREEIKSFLNQKYLSPSTGNPTQYNLTTGQYTFKEPVTGNIFEEFKIENNKLIRIPISLEEHIAKNGTMKIIPNTLGKDKVISFLNGYFSFRLASDDSSKVVPETSYEVKKDVQDAGDIENVKTDIKPAEKVKKFKKINLDIKDDNGLTMNRIIPMKSTPEEIANARDWFAKSPLSKYIKYEELFNVVNSNAWAEFVNGGIKLYAGSDYTVLYHEAFHAFTQHFLSKEDKIKLYKEAIKLPQGKKAIKEWAKNKKVDVNDLSEYDKYLAIEELLAEGFRQYVLSDGKVLGKTPIRNSIFRDILDFLRALFGIKLSQSQIATDEALINVEEVYAQLYIGNINNYRPSIKNAYFTESLYSTPTAIPGQTININDQDALLIVQSIDGVISQYIDERNIELQNVSPGDTRYTSAIFTNPEKHLTEVYTAAYNAFIDKYEELTDSLEKANELEKPNIISKINLLEDALTNFGDPESPIKGGGILSFHMKKSPYISSHIKNLDKEAFDKTKEDIAATRYDVKGNELSRIDLASNRVSYLIGSIKKFDDNGNLVKNELGFPILMEFNQTFGKLASIIGNNNNSPAQIKSTLLKAVAQNPWIDSLLRKLGPTLSPHHSVNDLWTGFWAAFYMSNQKLHQTMINETTDQKTGYKTYEVLTGYASAVFRQAERDFRSYFKISNHPNPYIIDNELLGNRLDTKAIIDKYKGKLYKKEFKFLQDIGIPLSDVQEIKDGLKDVNVEYLLDKLEMLHIKNIAITDVIQALRDPFTFKTNDGELTIKSESSNVNKILGLEVKYSGNYSNASVLTATGNVAYETSMMSSIAVMIKSINEAETFQDLISIPHMSYLDYNNNPSVRASVRLRSLFEFDPNTQTFGKRRKDVQITLDNLDGTQNIIENNYSDKDYSSATARSDKYTRLMQDIYSLFLEGKPSGITPGDKSTILSANINTIFTEGKDKHLYVDLGDFGKKGGQVNLGVERAYNILLPYLEGELQRIINIQKHQEESYLPNVEGYTSPDKKGNVSGLDFSAFKGVFQKETRNKLLEQYKKTSSLNNISSSLRTEMLKDMQQYFNFSASQTKSTLDRMLFIDKNLAGLVEKGVGEVVNNIELNDIIIKAYTVNKFIHNLDDITLFYGDLAQYKDLDKRGSALNSVGRMFRTDSDALTYVNEILKRPYSEKQNIDGYKEFDGILDTAILSEDIETSAYIDEYKKALKDANYSDSDIKRITEPYEKMETGDAQGYITFDSYRILAKLENRWSDQQEALYNQIVNNPESVKIKDITEYFPVRKYQYFGPLAVQGIHATAFHKFSLFPLIPTVIKNTKLEVLHNNLMKNGIDYATFKTGSKVGSIVAPGTTDGDILYNPQQKPKVSEVSTKETTIKSGVAELFESNPELANEVYKALEFSQESDLKPVSKEIPFNYGNNKELVLNGDKTITSRNFKFIPNLQAGESGLQVIDGVPFKVTYHGELRHSEVKDKVGIDYSEGEAFAKTTKGKPTEKATEDFIKGVGTKHIYQLQKINTQITSQQKQQAQQLYSQYLDTTDSPNIEGFKEFVTQHTVQSVKQEEKTTTRYNPDKSIAQTEYTKNKIYLNYLKDQLDINSEFKGKVIFSTQLRKLIEEGLIEGGVPIDYKPETDIDQRVKDWEALSEDARLNLSKLYPLYKKYESNIKKLIEFRKAELRSEIGSTEEQLASGQGNIGKLVKFIQRELDRQDLAEHEIDFIEERDGKLVRDLSISPSASKIERALNAIVNNRLVRQKVNGEALVQVANSMWEPATTSDEEKLSWGTKELKTYRKDSTGKTLGMDVKIALQGDFKNLIHLIHKDGKKVAVYNRRKKEDVQGNITFIREINSTATLERLNETIKDPEWRSIQSNIDMITMVGVRIPVQGLNSMEFMTVYEFLPEAAGNIIVPPAEIVAKSGSDFDIDKLTIMMPTNSLVGGVPEITREIVTDPITKLNRTEEINEILKELRSEKSMLQEEVTAKFKEISPKDLSEDDKQEIRIAHKYFDKEVQDLKSQLKVYEDNVTRLTNMINLNEEQVELLSRSWIGIDETNKFIDIMEAERRETINEIRQEMRQEKVDTVDTTQLKKVSSEIIKLEKEKASLQGKAIENNLIFDIRNILELPINFISLITPNDTSLVKPLADELSKHRQYSELEGAWGKTDSRDATRYLEPAYNIYKHDSNTVGKETLGLGAVDNTYNTIFNRIGAYMNPEYLKGTKKSERRATILMDHNTRETKDGKRGISLSHLYDVNNDNKIADIINQLMNGWVDVAKDAWIFDIQGNKQVSPVLLFLIQSGVHFNTAVHFVSNPLIKEYVKEQIIATSAFAKPNRENPASASFYRDKAKIKMFDAIRLGNVTKLNQQGKRIIDDNKLYKTTLSITEKIKFDTVNSSKLSSMSLGEAVYSKQAQAAFLHYLELEELAKGVSNLKLKLNYDTSRSNSLFDAQKTEADLITLASQSMFPSGVVESILDESPVGSFRIAPFQLELWGPLFEIRNNKILNNFLITKLSEMKNIKKMEKIYGSTERYIEEYKNDIIVKIFTDGVKKFNINDTTYKGHELIGQKGNQVFKRGAAYSIENNKLYIDKETLDMQYDHNLFSNQYISGSPVVNNALRDITYGKLNLARIPIEAFKTSENGRNEYYHFVIEREYQRALNPFNELTKTDYFEYRFKKNINKYKGVINMTGKELENEVLKRTYEEMLRDMALDNTMNYWKIFKSEHTAADQLYEIKEMHPELNDNIVRDLIVSQVNSKTKKQDTEDEKETIKFKNIVLRDNRVTEDLFNIYHNNMLKLSDSSAINISIEADNVEQGYIENKRVAKFFSRLPLVGFLQSGLNTKDSLSIMRAMPVNKIVDVIQEEVQSFKLDERFLKDFMSKFDYQNRIQNISMRRRLKDYVTSDHADTPNRELIEKREDGNIIIDPMSKKELIQTIENNPDILFILETSSLNSEFEAGSLNYDNIIKLNLRSDKESIEMAFDNIEKLIEAGTPVAFLNRGIGYGRAYAEKNKKTGQMIDQQMYEYITTELYSRFGYENSYSRSVSDVKDLIEKSQEISDFDLEISYSDLSEARERLNCNL